MMAIVEGVVGDGHADVIFRWASLMIVQGVIFAGMAFGYFSTRSKVREVKTLSEPTGNGHAKRVEDALSELKTSVGRVENKIDTHVMDHASSSLKDNHDRVLQARRSR